MTVHRIETIFNKRRLAFVVEMAEHIAQDLPVIFVIHGATRKKLAGFGLLDRILENDTIRPMDLMDHSKLIGLIANAAMVVTDGGSVQEECSYLGIPCLILRSETERQEGLDRNVRLCNFDKDTLERFLTGYRELDVGRRVVNVEPSREILAVNSGSLA